MMLVGIARTTYTPNSVTGILSLNGVYQCYTLEPSKVAEHPCIPAGRYKGSMMWSHHFQRVVPHILNVPGRAHIEIHNGNVAADTHGCVIVGQSRETDFVGQSFRALDLLIPQLPAEFEVEVTDNLEAA